MQSIFARTYDDRWASDTFGVDQLPSVDDGSWDTPAVPKRAEVGTASWATNPARPRRAREEAGSWDTATVRETTHLRVVSSATSPPRLPPSAAVEEPVRDWSFIGSLTVHRVLVIFYVWFAMLAPVLRSDNCLEQRQHRRCRLDTGAAVAIRFIALAGRDSVSGAGPRRVNVVPL